MNLRPVDPSLAQAVIKSIRSIGARKLEERRSSRPRTRVTHLAPEPDPEPEPEPTGVTLRRFSWETGA